MKEMLNSLTLDTIIFIVFVIGMFGIGLVIESRLDEIIKILKDKK